MSIYLGYTGSVELTRSSIDESFTSVVNPSDVNASRDCFSFDFAEGMLLTGDQLEITATDNGALDFVTGRTYSSGKWYINVDQVGSIRLYDSFANAVAGGSTGRVDLSAPSRNIPIRIQVANSIGRLMAKVTNYELNTSRDAVDVTEIGDEFKRQYGTLISGSGSIQCFFDYTNTSYTGALTDPELAVYMHQLIIRQQLGSEFKAKLYLVTRGTGADADDEVWYEFNALITNVAMAFDPAEPVRSTIQFVTTGEIKLLVKTVSNYLVQEDLGRISVESSQGTGFVELEQNP
jgi:hypothetical protein